MTKKDLQVTSIRYFKTNRGVGYEAKTKTKIGNIRYSIWNDGNGGATYFDAPYKIAQHYTERELEEFLNVYERGQGVFC